MPGNQLFLKTLAGLLRPSSGRVEFLGSRVDGEDPNVMVDLGISLVPEGRELFSQLTVLENLELGAFTKRARPFTKETFEWVVNTLSDHQRAEKPACREDEWRRAANDSDRKGADVKAEASDA